MRKSSHHDIHKNGKNPYQKLIAILGIAAKSIIWLWGGVSFLFFFIFVLGMGGPDIFKSSNIGFFLLISILIILPIIALIWEIVGGVILIIFGAFIIIYIIVEPYLNTTFLAMLFGIVPMACGIALVLKHCLKTFTDR